GQHGTLAPGAIAARLLSAFARAYLRGAWLRISSGAFRLSAARLLRVGFRARVGGTRRGGALGGRRLSCRPSGNGVVSRCVGRGELSRGFGGLARRSALFSAVGLIGVGSIRELSLVATARVRAVYGL